MQHQQGHKEKLLNTDSTTVRFRLQKSKKNSYDHRFSAINTSRGMRPFLQMVHAKITVSACRFHDTIVVEARSGGTIMVLWTGHPQDNYPLTTEQCTIRAARATKATERRSLLRKEVAD